MQGQGSGVYGLVKRFRVKGIGSREKMVFIGFRVYGCLGFRVFRVGRRGKDVRIERSILGLRAWSVGNRV